MFADDMIVYIENPKESTTLLEVISMFNSIIVYKSNTEKSVIFLYTSNEYLETKIKITMPFTTTPEKIKYLDIHL